MSGKGIPDLDGKLVVLTSAASGIVQALAVALSKKGCHLALVDVNAAGLTALAAELTSAHRRVSTHVVDVADKARMHALAHDVARIHAAVHVLVNNAGIGYEAPFQQTSLVAWERIVGINLWGTVYGCHFFMPYLAKVERAHIVNLSSLFGIVGMAGQTAYSATKYAVRGFSEALWEELRATTISLTVVHPGAVATNIMRTMEGDDPELIKRLATWYETKAMAPEKAAAKIVAAVEKGKPRLLIGAAVVFADQVKRLLPVAGNRAICDLAIRALDVEHMREKRKKQWQETMVDAPWDKAQ